MTNDSRDNHIDYVEFPAGSPDAFAAAKRFYQEVFGWSFQAWGDEYADTKASGVTAGFASAPGDRPPVPLVVVFVADLEAAQARVIKAGGQIEREIISFPGGRRFEYRDPAGNRLGVWSDQSPP